jgi:hypothetical protein
MCTTIGILVISLVLFLFFKNKNILVIGLIVIILSYYFNNKEGLTPAQKKALINKSATQIGKTVKKVVNNAVKKK